MSILDIVLLTIIGAQYGVISLQYLQIQKLIDKLMSRNYTEYEQAKSQSLPLTAPSVVIPEDPEDIRGTFGGIQPL